MLLDANVLLYAFINDYPQHRKTSDWLTGQLDDLHRIALPWVSILAFVRIATNRRVLAAPLSAMQAWSAISALLDHPRVWIPTPGSDHRMIFAALLNKHQPTADLIMDLSLAALAIEHGLPVVSSDTDFARFPEVLWINPLD
jgi:uncharacterized protein